jgi:hypothetical protein
MKKLLLLALIVLVFGIAAYLFVFHKPHKNTFTLKAEYTITANELLQEFETDENSANSKYLGKIIQLEGEIVTVKNISGSYEISFVDELFGVTCLVDSIYAIQQSEKLEQLKVGDFIKVKGQCNGYLSDVKLDRCVVL